MKRPCRHHPTPEQLARLQEARRAWHADPAHRVRVQAAARGKPRREDGKFAPGTSSVLQPWPLSTRICRDSK